MVQPATGHVSVTSNGEDPVDLSTWKLEPVHGDLTQYQSIPVIVQSAELTKSLTSFPLGNGIPGSHSDEEVGSISRPINCRAGTSCTGTVHYQRVPRDEGDKVVSYCTTQKNVSSTLSNSSS